MEDYELPVNYAERLDMQRKKDIDKVLECALSKATKGSIVISTRKGSDLVSLRNSGLEGVMLPKSLTMDFGLNATLTGLNHPDPHANIEISDEDGNLFVMPISKAHLVLTAMLDCSRYDGKPGIYGKIILAYNISE